MRADEFVRTGTEAAKAAADMASNQATDAVNSGIVGSADKSGLAIKDPLYGSKGSQSASAVQHLGPRSGSDAAQSSGPRSDGGTFIDHGDVASSVMSGSAAKRRADKLVSTDTAAKKATSLLQQTGGRVAADRLVSSKLDKQKLISKQNAKKAVKGAIIGKTLEDTEFEGADDYYYKTKAAWKLGRNGVSALKQRAAKKAGRKALPAGNDVSGGASRATKLIDKKSKELSPQEAQRKLQSTRNQYKAIAAAKEAQTASAARMGLAKAGAAKGGIVAAGGGLGAVLGGLLVPLVVVVLLMLSLFMFMSCSGGDGGDSDYVAGNLPSACEQFRGTMTTACQDCGVDTKWVDLLLAMMAQESCGDVKIAAAGGSGDYSNIREDIMQAVEGDFGDVVRYGSSVLSRWGITPSQSFTGNCARASIYAGVLEFKQNLSNWSSYLGEFEPTDTGKVSLLLQGYNFGGQWFVECKQRGVKEWSSSEAQRFSNKWASIYGWKRYGDVEYPAHVLRYYSTGGSGGSGESAPAGSNEVVQRAYAELGKPYSWGAVGPSSYDCSGLVSYCLLGYHTRLGTTGTFMGWKHISNPQPGDICVNSHHCGIYIGNGKMIHAPQTGDVVKISNVHKDMIYVRR